MLIRFLWPPAAFHWHRTLTMSVIHLPFGALVSFADPPSVEPQILMPSPF